MKNILLFLFLLVFGIFSCTKKKQKVAWQDEFNEASKYAVLGTSDAQKILNEMLKIGSPCITNLESTFGNCVNITKDTLVYPNVYTFDYGSGCMDLKGNHKKGKIKIVINKHWVDTFHVEFGRSMDLEDFYLNDIQINGRMILTWRDEKPFHQAFDLFMNFEYSNNGMEYTFTQDASVDWIGYSTCETLDDEFRLSNEVQVKRDGYEYKTLTTESPIVWREIDNFPYSGLLKSGKEKYGTSVFMGGGLDHEKATIKANYKSKELTLNMKTRAYE